jgi:hypothetical protein
MENKDFQLQRAFEWHGEAVNVINFETDCIQQIYHDEA